MAWVAIGAAAVGVVGSAIMAPDQPSGGSSGGQPTTTGGGGGQQDPLSALMQYGLTSDQANTITQGGITANQQANPFMKSQALANTQLQNLMSTPGSMANDPQAQFAMEQGLQATNRGIAAQHRTNSGGAQMELMNYGQGMSNQNYNNRLAQLSGMASHGSNPAAGAQMQLDALASAQGGLAAGQSSMLNAGMSAIGGHSGFSNLWDAASGLWGGTSGNSNPSTDYGAPYNSSYDPNSWYNGGSGSTVGTDSYSTYTPTYTDYSYMY